MNPSLPIWQIHSRIVAALRTGNRLVLVAPTGSGKTTQVPQMLLDAGLAEATPDRPFPPDPDMPPYTLPEPLLTADGRPIATADEWRRIVNEYGAFQKELTESGVLQSSALPSLSMLLGMTVVAEGLS